MKNNAFLLFFALIPVFFSGCIIIFNHDFDAHSARFKNDSSHNIYIQSYTKLNDYFDPEELGNFLAYGISLQNHTIGYGAPLYDYEPYLEKILIIDTDTHKLLKKITGTTYFNMLTAPEIVVEKNTSGGKTTNYIYYFIITDEFLNNN
jgi:hypothetical protein